MKTILELSRPKTLLLSSAGVISGYSVSVKNNMSFWIMMGCLLTASLLQILSNFANDYGDFKKGTDNEGRLGKKRALQRGEITSVFLKKSIYTLSLAALIVGLITVLISGIELYAKIIFILLAVLAILAAILYTNGKASYGYKGLGDIFVFVFFGLVSVNGTSYLISSNITLSSLIVSVIIGGLSVAVLNLNNMRDIENDKAHNKNTLAVKFGKEKSLLYHRIIIGLIGGGILIYPLIFIDIKSILFLLYLPIILLIMHLLKIQLKPIPSTFDGELKWLTISAFSYSILLLLTHVLI